MSMSLRGMLGAAYIHSRVRMLHLSAAYDAVLSGSSWTFGTMSYPRIDPRDFLVCTVPS